jgi:topoisomerase-4 subunit A
MEENGSENESQQEEHKEEALTRVTGMYKDWFLDYASYVILERAVPAIEDGFKPVQRRIMHALKELDDGRYNKVANVVGHTMQYHPHGDASIADAMVQLGQKDLLIDTQGNWGNILTGDSAAASRYIEARLSKFALEVVFSPKITEWQLSYDGRKKEPVHLPLNSRFYWPREQRALPWGFPPRSSRTTLTSLSTLPSGTLGVSGLPCIPISPRPALSIFPITTTGSAGARSG